jgi:Zn-dependent protease
VRYYRDGEPRAIEFLRVLMRTFRVGVFFGVEVRMYWLAAILLPLISASWTAPFAGTLLELLVLVAIQFFGLFAVIWSHEMGHIAAAWRYGIRTDLITLSPLGGVAHLNAPVSSPREDLFVTLAGPALHVAWLAVVWPLQQLLPHGFGGIGGWNYDPLAFLLWFLVTTNQALLVFNLLPIFPLDGGRTLRALLSLRWHANRVTMWVTVLGVIGGALLGLGALGRGNVESGIGVCLGLSCIAASLNERRAARYVPVYGTERRAPWEADPDAWKRGGAPGIGGGPRSPGVFARWRAARAERRAAQRRSEQAELDREVDAILDRVHEVGLGGITDRERAILKRASKRQRGAG